MTQPIETRKGPHQGQPVLLAGQPPARARAAKLMVPGRGPPAGRLGTPRNSSGSLDGTPVFLGCSDVDFHIPKERVHHTAEVLRRLGGNVTERLYPNMGHTINQDEIDFVREMMAELIKNTEIPK